MIYCNLGLVVSGTGGVGLILILAASFKEGLKVEVTLTSLFLMVVSWAMPANPAINVNAIKMEAFICCLLNAFSKFCLLTILIHLTRLIIHFTISSFFVNHFVKFTLCFRF